MRFAGVIAGVPWRKTIPFSSFGCGTADLTALFADSAGVRSWPCAS